MPLAVLSTETELVEIVDDQPWLTNRLFYFRNLVSNRRTKVGVKTANAQFRSKGTTRWADQDHIEMRASNDNSAAFETGGGVVEDPHDIKTSLGKEIEAAIKQIQDGALQADDQDTAFGRQHANDLKVMHMVDNLCGDAAMSTVDAPAWQLPARLKSTKVVHKRALAALLSQMRDQSDDSSSKDAPAVVPKTEAKSGNAEFIDLELAGAAKPKNADPACSAEQNAALTEVMSWLDACLVAEAAITPKPVAPKLLIHGPGGTQ
jgi:hypothetical protein